MKENSQVIKAAGVVGAATLLSRILGYIRDVFVMRSLPGILAPVTAQMRLSPLSGFRIF
jgi:hypothetical protein